MRSSAADLLVRAERDDGFTLVELIVVMVVIGVLATVAVTSYLGFRDRAARISAQANVRTVIPALDAYHVEKETYAGATLSILRTGYDLQIDDSAASSYKISDETPTSFCLQSAIGGWYAWTTGPSQPIDTDSIDHC